jgi:ATPase subunit of ABC transporter with duplicated ATPase domains
VLYRRRLVGAIDVSGVGYARPGGLALLDDVTFRVGDGEHVALIGANGTGKTTLLRLVAGDLAPRQGRIRVDGRVLTMHQLMGSRRNDATVRDLLLSLAPVAVRTAAEQVAGAERAVHDDPSERNGMRLASAHAVWGDAGGWEAEVLWDACATEALGHSFAEVSSRPLSTLSGGEQKRLALEYLLRSDADVLLLDEPDNFLDVPGKEWLERQLQDCRKTILFVSHDRELLARVPDKLVTLESRGTWTHGGSFGGYHDARAARHARIEEEHRRFEERKDQLESALTEFRRRARMGSDTFASRVRSTKHKLERLDRTAPPAKVRPQQISMRLGGDRTGKQAVVCEQLELAGLTDPFDTEVHFGERVGVIGHNGTGKTHFLRLLAGEEVAHAGGWRLGARVLPGYFSQVHERPDLVGRTLLNVLSEPPSRGPALARGEAMGALRRYELHEAWQQPFETLSGGQQARFQILLLELSGATLLLLDEPTDNLDLASAEALEDALASYRGTVIVVTHDRWLMRSCTRFLVFGSDCTVRESLDPVYR